MPRLIVRFSIKLQFLTGVGLMSEEDDIKGQQGNNLTVGWHPCCVKRKKKSAVQTTTIFAATLERCDCITKCLAFREGWNPQWALFLGGRGGECRHVGRKVLKGFFGLFLEGNYRQAWHWWKSKEKKKSPGKWWPLKTLTEEFPEAVN